MYDEPIGLGAGRLQLEIINLGAMAGSGNFRYGWDISRKLYFLNTGPRLGAGNNISYKCLLYE